MEESTAGPGKRQQAASTAASGSVAPHLPEELVQNILLRLPSRSVICFRAVCKAWLQIVSLPEFAVDHNRLQPTLPLVSFLRDGAASDGTEPETTGPVTVDRCVDTFDLGAGGSFRPVLRFTADKEEQCGSSASGSGSSCGFHILGSLDGLLLLTFKDRFYVCNPATHQWTRLPTPLRGSSFAGFYRHEPTGEYRALFYRGEWPGTDYYIMAPDSRKGKGIGLPSEEKDGYKFTGQPYGPPVLVRGHLHWNPRQTAYGYGIRGFNTTTEVPTIMGVPVIREHMSLAAVGDELAMISCGNGNNNNGTMVELWLLKDYKRWVSMHRIQLPAVNVSTFALDESWRKFFMSEKGLVIVTPDPEQKLVLYDMMNGTLLESFPCENGRHLKVAPYTFKESLVRHAFFEREDGNAGDDEDEPEPPPFFEGL